MQRNDAFSVPAYAGRNGSQESRPDIRRNAGEVGGEQAAVGESAAAGEADGESGAQQEAEPEARPRGESRSGRRRGRGGDSEGEPAEEAAPAGPPLAELMPEPHRISAIVTSRHVDDRVYVSFDGHRTNDDLPHVFCSEDGGTSWSSIRGDLPDEAGSVRTIEEDRVNPELLYVGCEFGLYVSLDRGKSWTRLHSNLPTVPVHAIAQPPAAPEIVAGTHGRSLWILDVAALRQMTAETLAKQAHLFEPADAIRWRSDVSRGASGTRRFVGENPGTDARIDYLIGRGVRDVSLRVTGPNGELVRDFEASNEPGLHTVSWDMREAPPEGSGGRWRRGRSVAPGRYQVELTAGGTTQRATLEVRIDPDYPDETWLEYEDVEDVIEEEHEPAGAPRRRFH